MAKSLNKAMIIGNLGGKPESRFTPTGRQVTTVSVATTRQWKDAGGEVKADTQWHKVEFWGNLARIVAEHMDKGSRVYVEGRIETDAYDSKKFDGKEYRTKIVGLELIMLGDARPGAPVGETIAATEPELVGEGGSEEEFPF